MYRYKFKAWEKARIRESGEVITIIMSYEHFPIGEYYIGYVCSTLNGNIKYFQEDELEVI